MPIPTTCVRMQGVAHVYTPETLNQKTQKRNTQKARNLTTKVKIEAKHVNKTKEKQIETY